MSKPQNSIIDILEKHISRDKVYSNFRHPSLARVTKSIMFSYITQVHKSGINAELDIWIPSMNIGIEYHGEHHYHQVRYYR